MLAIVRAVVFVSITGLALSLIALSSAHDGRPLQHYIDPSAGGMTVRGRTWATGDGKRFVYESKGYVANGKAAMKQPKQTVALIFDEEIKKLPSVAISAGIFERLKQRAIEASTLEELASKIDAPAANVIVAVEAFNETARCGKTLDANPARATLAPSQGGEAEILRLRTASARHHAVLRPAAKARARTS